MIRLGISSYTFTWSVGVPGYRTARPLTAFGLLDKATELGVFVVQIADNLPLDQLSRSDLDALARAAEARSIQIEVGTRGIAPDHLRMYLQLALRFGSPIVRVVVDTAHSHPSKREVVAALREVIPDYERAKVTVAVENHDRFPVATWVEILEQVGSPRIGICLDTVNSFGSLEGPAVVVKTLGPWTVNLHAKDFAVRRADHAMGFTIEGRPAGSGQLNVPWLLAQLGAAGRTFSAILELWTPPAAAVADTIATEDEWARTGIAYLRTLIPD